MPAGKRQALALDKPFEEREVLDLMSAGIINEIYEINMPRLKHLYLSASGAKNLPISSLKHLEFLTVNGGDFGFLNATCITNAKNLDFWDCGLTYGDFSNLSQLESLSVGSNSDLTWIDLSGCHYLFYISARYCSFSSDSIESITCDLVDNGIYNGYLYLNLGQSAAPNSTALGYIDILVSRGWYVYTN